MYKDLSPPTSYCSSAMAQANSTGVQWLSNAEKRAIRNVLPSQAYKIMAAAHVKLYHARFTSLDWSYSGHQGVLVFGRNRRPPEVEDRREAEEEKYWFKMIDPHKERETWRHGIPRLFDYKQETPFWHTFGGESRTYGLRFEEDEEGSTFFRKVTTRVYPDADAQAATILRSRRRQKIHITSDDISSPIPGTFQHIVHMGPDGKGFAQPLQSFDPRLIDGLRRQGVSEKVLTKSMHFIQDFVSDCSRSTSEASRLTQSST